MPDDPNPAGETPEATKDAAPAPETGKDGKPFDAERAMSTIEALRAELKTAKSAAKETETLKARVTEFEREKLSETERQAAELADLKAKNAALESQYHEALIRTAIEREAIKAGAVDPDVVAVLIDRSSVGFDDDGRVKGADKAVEALLKAKPYLVKPEGNATKSPPPTGRANGQPPTADERVKAAEQRLVASGRYGRL